MVYIPGAVDLQTNRQADSTEADDMKNLLQALRTFILVKLKTMEVNRNGKGSTI